MFGERFQGMGFTELIIFSSEDNSWDSRVGYTCEDARKVTDIPVCRTKYETFANMFPLTLKFVR